ncbi:MAG: hypothetical protein JOZ90_08135 [Alphaproteobacteria bacterium]|nr:hypothetical protein [Alphaproteobacteria bacterium]MBV9901053.1 hypothetical protein [Alphaproteobacteria bacterium]
MPNTLTLSLVGGLTVAGAALGLGLGRSAIGEINPAYFAEPETSFHADLAGNRTPVGLAPAGDFTHAEPLIVQCIGCANMPAPDFPVEYVPRHDPMVDAVTRWPEPRRAVEAQAAPEEAAPAPDPARERIVRYASYPVTEDEAREMAARDAPVPAATPASAPAPAQENAATQ